MSRQVQAAVVLWLLYVTRAACRRQSYTYRRVRGHELPGPVLATLTSARSPPECAKFCSTRDDCHGYNYRRQLADSCQLLGSVNYGGQSPAVTGLTASNHSDHYYLTRSSDVIDFCWLRSCYQLAMTSGLLGSPGVECEPRDGKMAELESQQEAEFVQGALGDHMEITVPAYCLGGHRATIVSSYVWRTSGELITSDLWASTEPSPGPNAVCMGFLEITNKRQWYALPCSQFRALICEFEARN